MSAINKYIKLPYKMEIIEDIEEGGYTVIFPDLEGCITCGDTLRQAIKNAKEAKEEWMRAAIEEEIMIPEPVVSKR